MDIYESLAMVWVADGVMFLLFILPALSKKDNRAEAPHPGIAMLPCLPVGAAMFNTIFSGTALQIILSLATVYATTYLIMFFSNIMHTPIPTEETHRRGLKGIILLLLIICAVLLSATIYFYRQSTRTMASQDESSVFSTTTISSQDAETRIAPADDSQPECDFVANTSTRKFHRPSCSSVDQMDEGNKWFFHGTRDDLIEQGYTPCGRCSP